MNFADLCDFFDSMRSAKSHSEKVQLSKSFFKKLRGDKLNLFPILRLVVPKLDRDRPSYRIKESKISKLLIKMLGLPNNNDKNLLLKSVSASSVDFGDVIYSVLKKYIVSKEIGLNIENINTYLDKIANRAADNGLDDLILEIFRKLSPKNIKWLIQIILKDLKLGISDNVLLNSFHPDGANFYSSNNNLRKLCDTLSNPNVKVNELEINVFEAFKPMLSKRCDAKNFKKCFPDGQPFFIENKFDGERFQLHMENNQFKYFSRNGFDFTNSYGSSFNNGPFTCLLKNVFDSKTKKLILDGEMMLWNKNTKKFGSKGMNLDVKKLVKSKYQPCFCVFDILLYNNEVLTNKSLRKRLEILKNVIKNPIEGTIILSTYIKSQTKNEIVDALNSCVDNNEEGIVVKDPKSIYKFGDRNSGWYKIKMEYFDDVVHDLDVLMMGGFFGANNNITSLIIGISSGVDTYLSFGRISSGLNDEQLDIINEKLKTHGFEFKHFATKTEGKLHFGRETPDIYIEPEQSFILTIRATELIKTTSEGVKCPYTLRFPRVLRIRNDKPVNECLSMNELLDLTGQNTTVVKLNKRHIELDEIVSKTKPSKKIRVEVVNLTNENGDFLSNKKFYVDCGTEKWTSEEIYHSIIKSGGKVSYRLDSNVDIILTSKLSAKLVNLMKHSNRFDIIHVDWLRRALEYKELINYDQKEIFYLGANFQRDISTDLDQFSDSFTNEANDDSLRQVLSTMTQTDDFFNTNNSVILDKSHLFAHYYAYFDCFETINDTKSKRIYYSFPDEMEFLYYRGNVTEKITPDVNLIIIDDKNEERKELIFKFLQRQGLNDVNIVTRNFIKDQVLMSF